MNPLCHRITPMTAADREPVMDVFNYYIEHTFAAFREDRLPPEAFDVLLAAAGGYPSGIIRDDDDRMLGFGALRGHKPIPEFAHTAEVLYFLHPDWLGVGLGKTLLNHLETEARRQGITTILAQISSLNPLSLAFHARNGFQQCGCFKNVGKKHGKCFDTIWMQKTL